MSGCFFSANGNRAVIIDADRIAVGYLDILLSFQFVEPQKAVGIIAGQIEIITGACFIALFQVFFCFLVQRFPNTFICFFMPHITGIQESITCFVILF